MESQVKCVFEYNQYSLSRASLCREIVAFNIFVSADTIENYLIEVRPVKIFEIAEKPKENHSNLFIASDINLSIFSFDFSVISNNSTGRWL